MSKFNFKNVISATAKLEGVPMSKVANDLQCESSVLSNVLSGRFTSANKEKLLKERAVEVLTEFKKEVFGEVTPREKDQIEEFVDKIHEQHIENR